LDRISFIVNQIIAPDEKLVIMVPLGVILFVGCVGVAALSTIKANNEEK
jgi:hypothetical protein